MNILFSKSHLIASAFFCFMLCTYATSNAKLLKIGNTAPNFSLVDQYGVQHSLSDYRGQKVALYFYPDERTPHCQAQACSIRDGFADLEQAGIIVLGLSMGSLKNKQRLADKHRLPFPLLQATKRMLCSYGMRTFLFTNRLTYLINEDGIVVGIIKDIKVKDHAWQIINAFKQSLSVSFNPVPQKETVEKKEQSTVVYLHEQETHRSNGSKALQQAIQNNKNTIVIFYEDWCGPCNRMAPIFKELAREIPNILFFKVKREFYRSIFNEFHLKTVPAILFFKNGILIKKQLSSLPKDDLRAIIKKIYA